MTILAFWEVCSYDVERHTLDNVSDVEAFDILIAEFESTNAASRATGLMRESISHACHGKSKTAGGYIWKFKTN